MTEDELKRVEDIGKVLFNFMEYYQKNGMTLDDIIAIGEKDYVSIFRNTYQEVIDEMN